MNIIFKICTQCAVSKDVNNDFQKQKNICKICTKQNYKKRREEELQSVEPKTCIHCGKVGYVRDFISLKNICKSCDIKKKQERYEKKKDTLKDMRCSHCKQIKPFDDFKKGLQICKLCCNESEHKRRSNWSEEKVQEEKRKGREYYKKIAENPPTIDLTKVTNKICTICLETKSVDEFYLHKKKGTIRSACKICLIFLKKQYYEKNKEKYNKQIVEYQKKKIKTDSIFHFYKQMRCKIYIVMKMRKIEKDKRTLEYIGCTTEFFQKWMEFQLYDGMTLENYGKIWHVDHTKPIASFDLTKDDQCKECFSWKNCRPFLAHKNIQKSTSYQPFDSVLQELKAHFFFKIYTPPATVK